MGEGTIYKRRIEYVAWCLKCDSAIRGNGSVLIPYNCECRTYKYSSKADGYVEYTDGVGITTTGELLELEKGK